MPRYHFNCVDGSLEPDVAGIELADDHAAHAHAMKCAGEVLQSEPAMVWAHGQWRVEVTDDDGAFLFGVITIAFDAARPGGYVRKDEAPG